MTLLKHYALPFLALACISFLLTNCKKDTQQEPSLQFSFKFDSNQERLNNLGLPSTIPGVDHDAPAHPPDACPVDVTEHKKARIRRVTIGEA